MRANVYIDGFNLYYGALKSTPYPWLDRVALSKRLLPKDTIQHPSWVLKRQATFFKNVRRSAIAGSQFAEVLTDAAGIFRTPSGW